MSLSKISVDLNQRSFEIEVPAENVEAVLKMLGDLFAQLPPTSSGPAKILNSPPEAAGDSSGTHPEQPSEEQGKSKRKRSPGKGGAKVRAPELVDLELTPDQRRELVSFFAEKAPKGQNDQVAVLGVKLKEFKGKSEFNMDEMHSAFKVVQKATPKNLIAVFGNMKRDGKAGYSDSQLVVNSFTEDHVAYHMQKEAKGE